MVATEACEQAAGLMEVFSLPPVLPACLFAVTSLCRAPIPLFWSNGIKRVTQSPAGICSVGLGRAQGCWMRFALCFLLVPHSPRCCAMVPRHRSDPGALSLPVSVPKTTCARAPVLGGLAPRVSAQPHSVVMVASCALLHGQISRCQQGQEVSGVEHLPLEAPSQSFTSLAPVCRWRKVLLSKKTLTSSAGL